MESIFNGERLEIEEPLSLLDSGQDDIDVVMTYKAYLKAFGSRSQNIGHYYNEVYGFAVLYFADPDESEILEMMGEDSIRVKLRIYRQKIVGEVKKVVADKDYDVKIAGFAYSETERKYQMEAGRANMWIGIDLDDDWRYQATNKIVLNDAYYYEGFEIRGLLE